MKTKFCLTLSGIFFVSMTSLASEINGTWETSCTVLEEDKIKATTSFNADGFVWSFQHFADEQCAEKLFTRTVKGTFNLYDFQEATPVALDLVLGSYEITYHNPEVVTALNTESYCGMSNWQVDVAQVVSGLSCGETTFPAADTAYYDLVKVESAQAVFGEATEENDASTPDKRPVVFDEDLVYTQK